MKNFWWRVLPKFKGSYSLHNFNIVLPEWLPFDNKLKQTISRATVKMSTGERKIVYELFNERITSAPNFSEITNIPLATGWLKNRDCGNIEHKKGTGRHVACWSLETAGGLVFCLLVSITKTYLYNFDPPPPPSFYTVKLGFTGVYIIFLISAQNIDCRYSLEPPRRGGSNEYPQSMFWAEIRKKIWIFIWKFSFFGGTIFSIFE